MEKTIDQFYADAYNQFFSFFNIYNQKLVGILQSMLSVTPNYILDLACGVGLSTLALSANFCDAEIIGVDIDSSLIDLARKAVSSSRVKFNCCEIADLLDKLNPHSLDLIFVKSAYHYFEHQITLPKLQHYLKKNGVIVIAERTARSAKSYSLPEIASNHWTSIFAEPYPSNRLDIANLIGMSLTVSCYGEQVLIPTQAYLDTVRENQLVSLWMLKPEVIAQWIEQSSPQNSDGFYTFEEFWLYVYHNR